MVEIEQTPWKMSRPVDGVCADCRTRLGAKRKCPRCGTWVQMTPDRRDTFFPPN